MIVLVLISGVSADGLCLKGLTALKATGTRQKHTRRKRSLHMNQWPIRPGLNPVIPVFV